MELHIVWNTFSWIEVQYFPVTRYKSIYYFIYTTIMIFRLFVITILNYDYFRQEGCYFRWTFPTPPYLFASIKAQYTIGEIMSIRHFLQAVISCLVYFGWTFVWLPFLLEVVIKNTYKKNHGSTQSVHWLYSGKSNMDET